MPISSPGVPVVCSDKSPGICPGAECSQSVFPGPSASPGKLQIIGPIPGPLNQTQGAGRSRGPGREETAGDGPAQAQQGILTRLEQRSPSGPHGPLPVHTAHFRSTRPTSGPQAQRQPRRFQTTHPGIRPRLQRTEDCCCCSVTQLCLTLLRPHRLQPARLLYPWAFPGKNTGVGCHFLLQGIFPIQGSNPCPLRQQADSSLLSHQGGPASRKRNKRARQRRSLSKRAWCCFRSTRFLP